MTAMVVLTTMTATLGCSDGNVDAGKMGTTALMDGRYDNDGKLWQLW